MHGVNFFCACACWSCLDGLARVGDSSLVASLDMGPKKADREDGATCQHEDVQAGLYACVTCCT